MATTISVDAVGRQEALPDQATIEARTIGTGEAAPVALAAARDRATTVRAALDAVSSDRLRVVELQVEATADMFDPVSEAEYEATATLEVECSPEVADEVVTDLADAGSRVRRIEYELHNDHYRTLRNEAVEAATEQARRKAARIAAAEDLRITSVEQISTTADVTEEVGLVEKALDAGPDASLHPSPIEVVESVEAVYEATHE